MRTIVCFVCFFGLVLIACQSNESKDPSAPAPSKGFITDLVVQDSLFKVIDRVTGNKIDSSLGNDSLEFLFLPVTASCPACRKKTIDSIVKFQNRLDDRHFVVVTGSGRRIIKGYFEEMGHQLPDGPQIFYDTTGTSRILTSTNPNIYFAVSRKVYRKLSSTPATIKADLKDFFEGL